MFLGWASSVDEIIQSKILTIDKNEFRCADCDYVSQHKQNLSSHIEANHVANSEVFCPYCPKSCPTRNALRMHISRTHKKPVCQ